MVHLKPQYADPHAHYINGHKFRVVKMKRYRIHPARIAGAMTFGQVIVESLMERYPWVVIENAWGWLIYQIHLWRQPKFVVPLSLSGSYVRVKYHKPPKPDWIQLSSKRAQRPLR